MQDSSAQKDLPELNELRIKFQEAALKIQKISLFTFDTGRVRENKLEQITKTQEEVERLQQHFLYYVQEIISIKERRRKKIALLKERSQDYIKVTLLQLQIRLLLIHDVPQYWFTNNILRTSDTLLRPVEQALTDFSTALNKKGIKYSTTTYLIMATAFRVFADQFSLEATTIAGWLDAAKNVSRKLRLKYHQYRTKEVWAEAREQIYNKPYKLIAALVRSSYGIIAGYGLKITNFVCTAALIILIYSIVYWLVDSQGIINANGILYNLYFSVSLFTLIGVPPKSPTLINYTDIQYIGKFESLMGYIMLGILASVFWASFNQRATEASSIQLMELLEQQDDSDNNTKGNTP